MIGILHMIDDAFFGAKDIARALLEELDREESPIGLRALNLARLEIGNGERGNNNSGPDIERYRLHDGTGKSHLGVGSWCASFCSYCYTEANGGIAPFRTMRTAKGLVKSMAKAGRALETPEPGALISWHRGLRDEHGRWTWRGHVEIVDEYDADTDTLKTIAGNIGRFPARVKVRTYRNGSWRKRLALIATLD